MAGVIADFLFLESDIDTPLMNDTYLELKHIFIMGSKREYRSGSSNCWATECKKELTLASKQILPKIQFCDRVLVNHILLINLV